MNDHKLSEAIDILSQQAHATAREKGFHDYTPVFGQPGRDARHILSLLMLVTTEVAEAAEEVRKGTLERFGAELADIVIRVLDLAAVLEIDLGREVVEKMEINRLRPMMNGGKRV